LLGEGYLTRWSLTTENRGCLSKEALFIKDYTLDYFFINILSNPLSAKETKQGERKKKNLFAGSLFATLFPF
jgi:hypothetical protein